jgi:hypothetical protein
MKSIWLTTFEMCVLMIIATGIPDSMEDRKRGFFNAGNNPGTDVTYYIYKYIIMYPLRFPAGLGETGIVHDVVARADPFVSRRKKCVMEWEKGRIPFLQQIAIYCMSRPNGEDHAPASRMSGGECRQGKV